MPAWWFGCGSASSPNVEAPGALDVPGIVQTHLRYDQNRNRVPRPVPTTSAALYQNRSFAVYRRSG